MPTPNFTPNTTPPTPITLPAMAPTGAAPTAVPLGFGANTAVAPTGVTLPGMNPTANGANPVTLPGMAPSAVAPTAVPLPGMTPNAAAPSAVPLPGMKPLQEAPRPVGFKNTPQPSTDENVNTPTIILPGSLTLNQVYGQFRAPQPQLLERAQVNLTEPPVGAPATFDLVDAAGVPWGVTITVAAGATFGEAIVNPNALISLQAGSNVFAKATGIGSTQPGGFGAVTLFTRNATN